jgi:hypothetical protein
MTIDDAKPIEGGRDFDPEMWNADGYRKLAKEYRDQVAKTFAASVNNQRIGGVDRRYWSSVISYGLFL